MRALGLIGVLVSSLAAAQGASAEEARTRFERGVGLYDQGDYTGALAEFDAAYRAAPRFELLFNIGVTQRRLFRYGDAVKSLERYLAEGGAKVPAARTKAVQKELVEIRALTAEVTVSVVPDGVAVEVDGKRIGEGPLEGPLLLGSGPHKFRFTREGYLEQTKEIELISGTRSTVAVLLDEAPKVATTARLEVQTEPRARVSIDGQARGDAPTVTELNPGGHLVTAEKDGFVSAQQEVMLTAGQMRTLNLNLKPVPVVTPIYGRWYFWTGIAVVVAGGITGGYFLTRRQPDAALAYP